MHGDMQDEDKRQSHGVSLRGDPGRLMPGTRQIE